MLRNTQAHRKNPMIVFGLCARMSTLGERAELLGRPVKLKSVVAQASARIMIGVTRAPVSIHGAQRAIAQVKKAYAPTLALRAVTATIAPATANDMNR